MAETKYKDIGKIISVNLMKKANIYNKKFATTQFLKKLARYKLKGGPKDLAQYHDYYIWK